MIIVYIALWAVIGLLLGWIASKLINLRGDDPMGGILVAGAASALAGGIASLTLTGGLSTWHAWPPLWSAAGALLALILWHAIRSRYVSRAPQTVRRSY